MADKQFKKRKNHYLFLALIGTVITDPNMRYVDTAKETGKPVTNFRIAVDDSFRDTTTFFNVTTWGKLAEICNEHLKSGRTVLVTANAFQSDNGNPRMFERKDGTFGASYEITADDVKFLDVPKGDGNGKGEAVPAGEEQEYPF